MRIDLNCPAEILGIELPREELPYATLGLLNLDDRVIVSCEVTLKLKKREGEEAARTVHRARSLSGRPHGVFSMTVPIEAAEGAVSAEATLDKVWFEDNDVWRRNAANEIEYESNALPPGNSLNALKYVAGDAAVGFPSQQARLWVCVCGRPNDNRSPVCARCRRQKDMIFRQYARHEVEAQVARRERQLDLQSRGAREETARLQRLREEEFERERLRRDRRKRLLAAFLAALILTAAAAFGILPGLRLLAARRSLREGRLEEAEAVFQDLGAFPSAEAGLTEARLQIARRDAAASENAETLAEASARLKASGDPEDAALADAADLKRARLALSGGDVESAETLAQALPASLSGRDTLLKDCVLARADALLAAGKFEEARPLYLSLGSYGGAKEKAQKCLYDPALTMIEAGEYDAAIANLSQIPDYLDSGELMLKSWYLKGYTLEMAGDDSGARVAYLAAGEYEDAPERAKALLRARADALLAEEKYTDAMPLYRELDGYLDSRALWIKCGVEMARQAYRDREFQYGVEILDALPEETSDVTRVRTRSLYQGAKAAAGRQDYATAIAMLERIPAYNDASRLLREWRMTLAEKLVEDGKPEEAVPYLEAMGEDRNAARLLKKIREAQATETPPPESTPKPAEASATDADPAPDETPAPETAAP